MRDDSVFGVSPLRTGMVFTLSQTPVCQFSLSGCIFNIFGFFSEKLLNSQLSQLAKLPKHTCSAGLSFKY